MKTLDDFKRAFPGLYDHPGLFDFSPPPGWVELVWELSAQLEPLGVRAQQVKSKFGGLRFYIGDAELPPEVQAQARALISAAELRSIQLCEQCGQYGASALLGHWVRTCCDAHLGAAQRVTETPDGFEPKEPQP